MRKSILYVDDNAVNLLIVEKLVSENYDLQVAQTPEESLLKAKGNTFDIILIDLNFNHLDIDGYGILKSFKTIEHLKNTIFIAHSNSTEDQKTSESSKPNFDFYLPKPFNLKTFERYLALHPKITSP